MLHIFELIIVYRSVRDNLGLDVGYALIEAIALALEFFEPELYGLLFLAFAGSLEVGLHNGRLRHFVALLQVDNVFVLLPDDAPVLLKYSKQSLDVILEVVLGRAQVVRQLLDVLVEANYLVVLQDRQLLHLLDFPLRLLLLDFVALQQVHQRVDVV